MPTESQQEKTPLSQRIDKALWDFATLVHEHVDVLGGPKWNHCTGCQLGRHILESAIRERIDEARNEPRPEPGHESLESIIARAWPKDAPITKLREIAMALMDMVLEGNPRRREVQLGRWLESELDKLEAPQPTRAADIAGAAEPKPQHIFERHHVGERELADRRGAFLPRTSKHSLDWLMDTTPENLLKLERLSNTVYVLLGHRDPDKLAVWINRAHRIANEAASL